MILQAMTHHTTVNCDIACQNYKAKKKGRKEYSLSN